MPFDNNFYLNLRFVNAIHDLHGAVLTSSEVYSACHINQAEVLGYTARLFKQEHISSYDDLVEYLTNLRDRAAWKIGVFAFFYPYYQSKPEKLPKLTIQKNAVEIEEFIGNLEFSSRLNDFYTECEHSPGMAAMFSVSRVICEERRLPWMNTFCELFSDLLGIAYDTGCIAQDLVIQLDLVVNAYGLGVITYKEANILLEQLGKRIIKMYTSWGHFLAAILLSHLYEICLSSAEIRYLPRKAQDYINSFYIITNYALDDILPIPEWKDDDNGLKKLHDALVNLVDVDKLERLQLKSKQSTWQSLSVLDLGFVGFMRQIKPLIEELNITEYFTQQSKFDEFITVAHGRDFKVYFDSLHIPLAKDEFPLFIMKFNMFTNKGVWSIGDFTETRFEAWEDFEIEAHLPINHDYGNIVVPLYIPRYDCELNIQVPYRYKTIGSFLNMTSMEKAEYLSQDIANLKLLFTKLPILLH